MGVEGGGGKRGYVNTTNKITRHIRTGKFIRAQAFKNIDSCESYVIRKHSITYLISMTTIGLHHEYFKIKAIDIKINTY